MTPRVTAMAVASGLVCSCVLLSRPLEPPAPVTAIRLKANTMNYVAGHEVGVVYIAFGVRKGTETEPEIALAIYHPRRKRKGFSEAYRVGEIIELGRSRFQVVDIRGADQEYGGYAVIAPVD
jgi:hypothetical protein